MMQCIWIKRKIGVARPNSIFLIMFIVIFMLLMLKSSLFMPEWKRVAQRLKSRLENTLHYPLQIKGQERNAINQTCSNDRLSLPYLRGIYTTPPLINNFTKTIFYYEIEVDYEILVISVTSTAEHCMAEGRVLLFQKYKSSAQDIRKGKIRQSFSIGLSQPLEIQINVVEINSSRPVSDQHRYVLIFHRRPRGLLETFHADVKHEVCLLKQECDRQIFPDEPCGLQTAKYDSWSMVKRRITELPECQSGDEGGSWLLPCKQCIDDNSCYWHQAIWQPDHCVHSLPTVEQIQHTFDGKQLLFLGDSTLRGIMYYLIESVNGSLYATSKSHGILAHNNINQARTRMSFLYYPQLEEDPPSISVSLRSLVKSSHPVKNDSNTVLLVGRFSSIPESDFSLLLSTLKQLGLTGIKLVMKTMGSNRCTRDINVNVVANDKLTADAHRNGFEILQTFPIIMARHKDTTYGSCALHYHFIRTLNNGTLSSSKLSTDGPNEYGADVNMTTKENGKRPMQGSHVEGDVVAAYSNILISMLHKHWTHPALKIT